VSPNGTVVQPTAAQMTRLQSIVAADTAGMHNFNLQSDRKRGDLGFAANLTQHLQFSASVRHEEKNGFKPLGAVTSAVQENSVIIPDVIDTRTDQLNAGLEYTRRKGFLQVGYYGSIFHNRIEGMSWQDPNDPTRTATISSAPSNQFHQVNLAGGYNFMPSLRLTGDMSYGCSRQNAGFLSDPSLPLGLPETSAHALVVTKSANVRLAARPLRKLSLLAHYKYDDRDNQTPVNTFVFYDVNIPKGAAASAFNSALGLAPNTLGSNVNIFDNRPQSKKVNQFDLDADYALLARHKLAAGFQWQKIERACDHTWINCVNANESIERTVHAEWRASLLDSLTARIGAGYAERRVHYDPNAWLALVPMANVTPAVPGATTSVYGYLAQTGLTGFGPLAGVPTTALTGNAAVFSPNNNIVPQSLYGSRDNVTELPGMRRFNLADRDRRRVRSALDWQGTDRLSFTTTLELDDDDYNHSLYGLRRSTMWNAGLDTTYAVSDRLIATGFISHESMRSKTAGDGYSTNSSTAFVGRAGDTLVAGSCFTTVLAKNQNGKIDPCLNWTANMRDRADTVGFSLARRDMLAHRLDLRGDVIFTRAVTNIDVLGGSYSNNPFALAGAPALASGVPAVFLIPSANLPPVTTRLFEFRLSGRFAISKATDVRLLYAWQRMKAEDFAYAGMQYGTGTEQFPTNEQPPNYNVHLIAAYYTHRF
jgi:predicted porin